jgi:L,D-transpeptidase ErfK/SrfK
MPASRFLRFIPDDPMVGPDVHVVQERLRAFGFYQGRIDSIFGRATNDAVIAFQAQYGLTPDGVVGPDTYGALGTGPTPPPPGPKAPTITIDTQNLKLYFTPAGGAQQAYDVAVGAPLTPTPVGRWVIVEKIMNPGGPFGTRWMRMNIPWGGYGIHGNNDPSSIGKPVSHGCVRMHNNQINQLYPRVPIGTTVYIMGNVSTGRVLIPNQVSGSDVRAVQEQLTTLGYYHGDIDGVYANSTVEAVRRFQTDQGLTPDGIVGPATYNALGQAVDAAMGNTAP